MARLLRMPEVAANTLEATLSEWLLTEDAEFADGDAIATVETDKAAVEVPAEGAGVLVRTLVGPGATVAVAAYQSSGLASAICPQRRICVRNQTQSL